MQITWTNCADKMPPDDTSLIIVKISYVEPDIDYCSHGKIADLTAITSSVFLSEINHVKYGTWKKYWTPYTQEKWKELNNGSD